ncbi:MAG: hypothetical protein D6785_12015 [Planctomycetota bacterium]|nr:MAG: hypothetical protein D6785_12015 [Planctomycetota bacterium]
MTNKDMGLLMLGLIMFVMALAFGGLAFSFYNTVENKEEGEKLKLAMLEKTLRSKEKDRRVVLNKLFQMRAAFNGNYDTSPIFIEKKGEALTHTYINVLRDITSEDYLSPAVKDLIQQDSIGYKDMNFSTFIGLYPNFIKELNSLRSGIESKKGVIKDKIKELKSKLAKLEKKKKEKDEEIKKYQEQKISLQTQYKQKIIELERSFKEAKQNYEKAARKLTEVRDYYERIVLPALKRESESLHQVILKLEETIRKRKKIHELEPDGKVIASSDELGYVWIDLGRKHALRKGLKFRVFEYIKGGKRVPKGFIEVIKVGDTISRAKVVREVSSQNHIKPGDYLISPIFERNQKKIFVFAGDKPVYRFYSLEKYQKMLEDLGQIVENQVSPQTNFVVLLDGYENRPEYLNAKKYPWIIFIREEDLLDFLKN